MSVKDILKKSFLSQFNTDISTTSVVVSLFIAAAVAAFIFVVYRVVCRKAFYSKSFAISLPVISMITATIIMTIQSNAVISLGMVGALSIVRFRTALKDPMDLAFMFWSISVGIVCGAGMFELAIEATLLITIVLLVLHFVPNAKPAQLLLVNGTDAAIQPELEKLLRANTKCYTIKSRTLSGGCIDVLIELKPKDENALLEQVSALPGVERASLMSHDGEVTY